MGGGTRQVFARERRRCFGAGGNAQKLNRRLKKKIKNIKEAAQRLSLLPKLSPPPVPAARFREAPSWTQTWSFLAKTPGKIKGEGEQILLITLPPPGVASPGRSVDARNANVSVSVSLPSIKFSVSLRHFSPYLIFFSPSLPIAFPAGAASAASPGAFFFPKSSSKIQGSCFVVPAPRYPGVRVGDGVTGAVHADAFLSSLFAMQLP